MIHTRTLHTRTERARLLAVAGLLLLAAAFAPAAALAQQRELLGRFVQSDNEAAVRAFTQGRSFVDEQNWEKAASAFDRFVVQFPADRNVDAALYWLAYARNKQGNPQAADATLSRLLSTYPRSTWADDAKAMRAEVLAKLGRPVDPDEAGCADAELKIIALKALCENDKATCSTRVSEVLRSNSQCSQRVKEAAYILLGRYGGAEAVPVLIDRSRTEPDEKLRMRAIRALGSTNDERALDPLREIAMSAAYADESPTDSAIHALAEHDSPRAVTILGEVATRGQNPRARTHAIELLSRRRGEPALLELLRLYDAVPEVQVKQYVLAGLGMRKDPRALAKLVDVARSASDVKLRAQAIRAIPNRGDEQDLDVLLPLYDSERDADLKNNLLAAIGQYQNQRAYQRLEQVVRSEAEPLERRKSAISYLSRSKDPQVTAFLESLLK